MIELPSLDLTWKQFKEQLVGEAGQVYFKHRMAEAEHCLTNAAKVAGMDRSNFRRQAKQRGAYLTPGEKLRASLREGTDNGK